MRFYIVIAIGIVGLTGSIAWPAVILWQWVAALFLGIVAANVDRWLTEARNSSVRFVDWIRLKTILRRTHVRLSVSALVRIKIDDRYLLVKSNRIEGQYQPVGGVLKFLPPARAFLDRIGTKYRSGYEHDQEIEDDLRIFVPGRHISAFVKWFSSGENRELTPWREFYEELVDENLLPRDPFPWVKFRLIRTRFGKLGRSEHFNNAPELLVSQIFEPYFTSEQEQRIRELRLAESADARIKFVSEHQIETLGHDEDNQMNCLRIGAHTRWILEGDE